MALTITEGSIYRCVATFTDEAGAPVDPTSVSFHYERNNVGPAVTLTYEGATSPGPGIVARTAEGIYEAQVDTTGWSGYLVRYFQSTGIGQASSPVSSIAVSALPF